MRICLIGCGTIAPIHVNAILRANRNIAAICDVNEDAAKVLKDRFDINCAIYTDYKVMHEKEKPEAVHICTPHYNHCEIAVYFLQRNVHVLCEKPLGINFEQLTALEHAVYSSKSQFGVCFQNRYLRANIIAKNLLKGANVQSVFAIVPWHRDKAYYSSAGWRGKKDLEGGGVLINQAIHTIDLLLYFFGEIKSVKSSIANRSLGGVIDVEDTAECLFEFEGNTAVFFATNALGIDYCTEIRIKTNLNDIKLCADRLWVDGKEIDVSENIALPEKFYWGYGHEILIADFYRKIAACERFPLDYKVGYKAIAAVLDIYKSNQIDGGFSL